MKSIPKIKQLSKMNITERRETELKMLEINTSVKHTKDAKFCNITLGKEYSVYNIAGSSFLIKDDTGRLSYYSKIWFS